MRPKRDTPDRIIARIARRQHDVVTRRGLLAAGVTPQQIRRRVQRGSLHPIFRGVFAVGSGRLTPEARWIAGVLACGEGAVLSDESAIGLWRMGPELLSPVHVTAPTNRRQRPGLVVHRRPLAPEDICIHRGIPVTTPLRTLADLPPDLRDAAASKAVVLRLVRVEEVLARVYRSDAERREHARNGAPEHNVEIAGRERDFVWPDEGLIVELDGPHHRLPHERLKDERADAAARAAGWEVRRRPVR